MSLQPTSAKAALELGALFEAKARKTNTAPTAVHALKLLRSSTIFPQAKETNSMSRDLTAQFTAKNTMDKETLRDYERVCDPRLIVKDHLGKPTSLPAVHGQSPGTNTGNWTDPVP